MDLRCCNSCVQQHFPLCALARRPRRAENRRRTTNPTIADETMLIGYSEKSAIDGSGGNVTAGKAKPDWVVVTGRSWRTSSLSSD